MKFNVGDVVTWRSHSQGSWKQKTGRVEEIVPAKHQPSRASCPQLWTGAGPGMSRDHESYIVIADKKVYWPRVSKLSLAEEKVSA